MPSISSDALDQTLNTAPVLKYVLSKWTVKKDIVTGIDLGYLIGWQSVFQFLLRYKYVGFFLLRNSVDDTPVKSIGPNSIRDILTKISYINKIFSFPPNPYSQN